MIDSSAFHTLLQLGENEHLEFKEAKSSFEFEELVKYCAALANERGGKMLLGVTNTLPHHVVGSQAFTNLERTKMGLMERLHLRIETSEIQHPDGRVLVFEIPSRPLGFPIQYKGAYWMRAGESLVPMTADQLKRIFSETGPDYSAEICTAASLTDLDSRAIERLRILWRKKSGNAAIESLSSEQLLSDCELTIDGQVTYAALVLLGTRPALSKYLAQAEVIFEYRAQESVRATAQRKEYREGFLLWDDDLWSTVNLRNEIQHYQDGLLVWDIPTFNEGVIREAILNAVCHRDYRMAGSVFVRQYARVMEVSSPGGFPPGITPDTILWKQSPRNRRIAEVLARCGFVERSGQGVNLMFEESIKEGKTIPDFSRSDAHEVIVRFRCDIQDARFLRFLEKVKREQADAFSTDDFLVLDLVHRGQPIPERLRVRLPTLLERGIIERTGHGRGTAYTLSRGFYGFLGQTGTYTRRRGLDRDTNKELLLKHIRESQEGGTQLDELRQVLPALSRGQVQVLLRELRSEGKIDSTGRTRGARWHLAPKK